MKKCNFEDLVLFLDKRLNLDRKLEVLDHLDHCEICRDTIFHLSRDRDASFFYHRPYNGGRVPAR
jgi:hypothetical protein